MTVHTSREDYLDQISEEYLGVVWRDNPENIKGALSVALSTGWALGYCEANESRDNEETERDHHDASEN